MHARHIQPKVDFSAPTREKGKIERAKNVIRKLQVRSSLTPRAFFVRRRYVFSICYSVAGPVALFRCV